MFCNPYTVALPPIFQESEIISRAAALVARSKGPALVADDVSRLKVSRKKKRRSGPTTTKMNWEETLAKDSPSPWGENSPKENFAL